VVIEKI